MANNTDYSRLLDGYSLLAIKNYVDTAIATRAPKSHASSATTYGVGTSTNYGHVKLGPAQQNGATAADGVAAPNGHTHSQYLTGQTWREIKVAGTSKIGSNSSTALDFLNGTHSVQFTYNSGLYAEVDLTKYKPNGSTAFLDSSNKVSTTYLPDTVLGQLEYMGTWNATTPEIILTPQKGHYYICTTAGNKNPAGGTVTGVSYAIGDWAVYNGSTWDKVDNTDAITSIKWGTGTAQTGAISIPYATGSVEGVIKLGTTNTTAAYGNHTHDLHFELAETTTTPYTLSTNTFYWLTAGGQSVLFNISLTSNDITTILGYTPATSGHTHTTTIAADSGTNQLTLAFGTKYKLTAGGTSYVFTMPSNPNTWRKIQLNGTDILGNATNTNPLNLKAGTNVSITNSNGTVTFAATDTTYAIALYNTAGLVKPAYSNTTAITLTTAAASVSNSVTVAARTTTAGRYYGVEIDKDGRLYVNVPWSEGSNYYPTTFTWTNGTTAGPTGSLTGSGMSAVSFGAIPSASDTQSGIVTTGAQSFKGNKSLYGYLYICTPGNNEPSELIIGSNYSEGQLIIWDGQDGATCTIKNGNGGSGFYTNQVLYIPADAQTATIATREWSNGTYIAKTLTSAKGDMIYASAANTPARLAIGSNGQFLGVNSSGIPAWTSHAVSIATSSGTNQITLAYGTKYAITVNGASYVFTMPASDNTNYYPIRSYTSGLQISSYSGSQNCQLYVPYAAYNQAGVVSTVAQSFSGLKSFNSGINIGSYNITDRSISGKYACMQLHPIFYSDFGDNLEFFAYNDKGDAQYGSGNDRTSMNLVWKPGNFDSTNFFGFFFSGQTDNLNPETFSPLWLSYDNNVHIGAGTYGNGYLYLHKPGSMDQSSKAIMIDLTGITDNTYKVINPNTYSQTEATNILNGLNSDGTSI